jgi:hypothetical protein
MERAACHGMDTDRFFPDTEAGEHAAQQICARCSVRDECAAYAFAHDELRGVWGGLTERDRRHLRRSTWDPHRDGTRDGQPGPPPAINDTQLLDLLRNADPERPAAEQLRRQLDVSVPTIYKYLQRARALGAVERRGRNLYPRPR